MAFTGTPVIAKVSDRLFRITGVTLAGDASGTIGFSDKTSLAEVSLSAPEWKEYRNAEHVLVTLSDAIRCIVCFSTDVTAAVPISYTKSGHEHDDFVLTVHNDTSGTVSAALEIWVEFH